MLIFAQARSVIVRGVMSEQISYTSELARKGIHLSSLGIPILYLQLEHWTAISLLLAMTAVSFLIDVLMHYHGPSRRLLVKLVGPMLRPHEIQSAAFRLTGATWVLIAATLTFILFPKVVSTTAFSVLIVSDSAAALIGRRFGRRQFLDKSLVGTTAFVLSAIVVTYVYLLVFDLHPMFLVSGIIASVVGGIVEAASTRLRLDDNLSIPCSFAITMLLVEAILGLFGVPHFLH